MNLIISRSYDQSTCDVIEWLYYSNKKFVLINEYNKIENLSYQHNDNAANIEIETSSGQTFNYEDIKNVWYRRGRWTLNHNIFEGAGEKIVEHETQEWDKLNELLMLNLNQKKSIGSFFNNNVTTSTKSELF